VAMEKIGAYYQCYKNRKSLNFVLDNYRKHYPQGNVVLVCDGGDDFTEESIRYRCNYIHDKKIETEKNLIFKGPDSAKKFIHRISENIHLIHEEFFILLEDDVYIMNRIESDLLNDINGCNENEFFSESISKIINEARCDSNRKVYYGSFGGCILRTTFFKRILMENIKLYSDLDVYFKNSGPSEWASDKLLTYLCLVNGGTIGHYSGLCETWYHDLEMRLKTNSVEVLHQYKEHY
jgi:hypothetical protein